MKRILIFAICLVFMPACAPSAEAIQKAIAQTQTAAPTATSTPTPLPTNTPTITPGPSLTSLLLTYQDFYTLRDYYDRDPIIKETHPGQVMVDRVNAVYLAHSGGADITVELIMFTSVADASAWFGNQQDVYSRLQAFYSLVGELENTYIISMLYVEADINFRINKFVGKISIDRSMTSLSEEDIKTFLTFLAMQQQSRIESAGYH
jgi:hypothetical protein